MASSEFIPTGPLPTPYLETLAALSSGHLPGDGDKPRPAWFIGPWAGIPTSKVIDQEEQGLTAPHEKLVWAISVPAPLMP